MPAWTYWRVIKEFKESTLVAIVKGNSLRIFSCKNEKEPIMVERANFRGLKVSLTKIWIHKPDWDLGEWVLSLNNRCHCRFPPIMFHPLMIIIIVMIMIMGHFCFPLIVSHLIQEGWGKRGQRKSRDQERWTSDQPKKNERVQIQWKRGNWKIEREVWKSKDYRGGEISFCGGEPAGRERETAWQGTENSVERRMDKIQIVSER